MPRRDLPEFVPQFRHALETAATAAGHDQRSASDWLLLLQESLKKAMRLRRLNLRIDHGQCDARLASALLSLSAEAFLAFHDLQVESDRVPVRESAVATFAAAPLSS